MYRPSDDLLYAIENDGFNVSTLVSMSTDGNLTPFQLQLGNGFIGGLTFDPSDQLFYAIGTFRDLQALYSIDITGPGTVNIGYVYLEPGTWGRFDGLPVRLDIANAMQSQHNTVLRYGGSSADPGAPPSESRSCLRAGAIYLATRDRVPERYRTQPP